MEVVVVDKLKVPVVGCEWRCLWWAVSGGAYSGRSVEVLVVGGEWRRLW